MTKRLVEVTSGVPDFVDEEQITPNELRAMADAMEEKGLDVISIEARSGYYGDANLEITFKRYETDIEEQQRQLRDQQLANYQNEQRRIKELQLLKELKAKYEPV